MKTGTANIGHLAPLTFSSVLQHLELKALMALVQRHHLHPFSRIWKRQLEMTLALQPEGLHQSEITVRHEVPVRVANSFLTFPEPGQWDQTTQPLLRTCVASGA